MFSRLASVRGRRGPQHDGAGPALDGRTAARVKAALTSLAKLAGVPRLKLTKRAPCLKSIVTTLLEDVDCVFKSNDLSTLAENPYFPPFISHLEEVCGSVSQLLTSTPPAVIADVTSDKRSEVVRRTLLLNHMCFELKSQFHRGLWVAPITIGLPEAQRFWVKHFRAQHVVSWDSFVDAMADEFGREEVTEVAGELVHHVDFCEDGRVSWWEFDVFTKLFQPWDRILNTWWVLTKKHPGYKAWMTYEEVQTLLQPLSHKPGSYCFRMSVTKPGQWSIGFVSPFGLILQALPSAKSLYQALIDGAADGSYRYPLGQPDNIDPREHMAITEDARIEVSREQHEIYMRMDSQFELCKICHASRKNLRMDPCGHLICRKCFDSWNVQQRRDGNLTLCPFCRGVVSDTVTVEVENKHTSTRSDDGGDAAGDASGDATLEELEAQRREMTRFGDHANAASADADGAHAASAMAPRGHDRWSGGSVDGNNDEPTHEAPDDVFRRAASAAAAAAARPPPPTSRAGRAVLADSDSDDDPDLAEAIRRSLVECSEPSADDDGSSDGMAAAASAGDRSRSPTPSGPARPAPPDGAAEESDDAALQVLLALDKRELARRVMSLSERVEALEAENAALSAAAEANVGVTGELQWLRAHRSLEAAVPKEVPEDVDVSAEAREAYARADALEQEIIELREEMSALKEKCAAPEAVNEALSRRFAEIMTLVVDHAPHLLERHDHTPIVLSDGDGNEGGNIEADGGGESVAAAGFPDEHLNLQSSSMV